MASHRHVEVPLGGRLAVPGTTDRSDAPGSYAICSVCRGPAAAARLTCWSCRVVTDQLGDLLPLVVPLFLFGLGSPVHRALVDYKAGATAAGRAARAAALTAMLSTWLDTHAGCLLGGPTGAPGGPTGAPGGPTGAPGGPTVALVVPVPSSTGGRPSWRGRHPLESICEAAVTRSDQLQSAAVLRPGQRPPRRLQASTAGYTLEPSAELKGRAVMIVDDMFVSGSRALSAAAAVSRAGGRVAAVVPLGRLIRPDHNEATAAYWAARRHLGFDPSFCALCTRCFPARRSDRASAWPIPLCRVSERLAA
jgi:predicted amidophosphoribosyltransferase